MEHQAKSAVEHAPARTDAERVSQPASGGVRADSRPNVLALRKLAEALDDSPHIAAQRKLAAAMNNGPPAQPRTGPETDSIPRENNTGLPDQLKSGIESLSGISLDDVKVHYNSPQPAQLNAHAYAQGSDIHVAPGQERHLPHEAWHVVQQAQGRVKPTLQMKGVSINDDGGLEREADVMGGKAAAWVVQAKGKKAKPTPVAQRSPSLPVIQAYDMKYGSLINGCGSDMHVLIKGSSDPDLKSGSKPSAPDPYWWPDASAPTDVKDYFKNYVVYGHLLNQHLGGPGDKMENLTPITRSTNTTQFKKIEDDVKKAVDAGYWVEYRVRASYASSPTDAEMGNGAPASVKPYLANMAGEIGADYDIFDPITKNKIGGLPGEFFIKNEGPQNKGPY